MANGGDRVAFRKNGTPPLPPLPPPGGASNYLFWFHFVLLFVLLFVCSLFIYFYIFYVLRFFGVAVHDRQRHRRRCGRSGRNTGGCECVAILCAAPRAG